MTATTAPVPLPTTLDLHAIHEGLLAAGFTRQVTDPAFGEAANWVYLGPAPDGTIGFLSLPNPKRRSDDHDVPNHTITVRALDTLIAATGEQHLECGPRNDRERALIEVINATNNLA